MSYSWVSNPKKEERAIAELRAAKKEVTEEAVKELYVKYGGLVLPEDGETRVSVRKGKK